MDIVDEQHKHKSYFYPPNTLLTYSALYELVGVPHKSQLFVFYNESILFAHHKKELKL